MANLTLKIPDEDLKKARIQAIREGTSVNEVVRRFLHDYGGRPDKVREAVEEVLRLADKSTYSSGGRRWKREDIYAERLKRGR
ncbi:MAG: hypothetical protein HUU06_13060 [Planctomycetaceae bacterium]|nr:hypothetical protein [Planctomycetota bacterium]NUN53695.1 hypothetical protein [Planctomycetaceae bacterium]